MFFNWFNCKPPMFWFYIIQCLFSIKACILFLLQTILLLIDIGLTTFGGHESVSSNTSATWSQCCFSFFVYQMFSFLEHAKKSLSFLVCIFSTLFLLFGSLLTFALTLVRRKDFSVLNFQFDHLVRMSNIYFNQVVFNAQNLF